MQAYISLGSNLGSPNDNIKEAVQLISKLNGIKVLKDSKVYQTEPQGYKEQAWYANQVLKVEAQPFWTSFSLLQTLLEIEDKMGRIRTFRWGPRYIDLDLLLFGHEITFTQELILPHPRIKERAFILIPLLEIEPDLTLPDGESLKLALTKLKYKLESLSIWQT